MIPDAERRFGPDRALIARLEALQAPFPGQVTLLPEGMAVFGTGPFTIQQTRFGEGISPQLFADDGSTVVGSILKPMVVRTITDDLQILPHGESLEAAIAAGFDGIVSIPSKESFHRPYELLLPAVLANEIAMHSYRRLPYAADRTQRTIQSVAQRLRDEFSGGMPVGEVHIGDLKVRRNWGANVVVALDAILSGRYNGTVEEDSLRREMLEQIAYYRRRGLYDQMTSLSSIQWTDAHLTRIIERG